jgi:hypothetical protein
VHFASGRASGIVHRILLPICHDAVTGIKLPSMRISSSIPDRLLMPRKDGIAVSIEVQHP